MKRIIDKKTKLFLRDDFTYDKESEIAIEVEPAQGFYIPKWDGEKWVEGGQKPEQKPQSPTAEERLEMLEMAVLSLLME
ncbi:hypothetical protein [Neobacillus niacini]|uniref:hypothetical protein n=1 Tax=Neobacillus niacini TaxID=86668 RepID=UPI0021CAE760|nr:hypothetical protein [Neobacillus niacini]MCM3763434.1 hypothetical protein [Neobacillus niacini]